MGGTFARDVDRTVAPPAGRAALAGERRAPKQRSLVTSLLALQRTSGNQAVNLLLRTGLLQRDDLVGGPAVAIPPPTPGGAATTPSVQAPGLSLDSFPSEQAAGAEADTLEVAPAAALPSTATPLTDAAALDTTAEAVAANAPATTGVTLSAGRVARARSFYAAHSAQYTPNIIGQIQAKVGVAPTGTIDDATIQGVAAFQMTHFLTIDGMAGVRTLPALFPTGLAAQPALDQYVKEAKAVTAQWASLATADARAHALMEAVTTELTATEVFIPTVVLADTGGAAGTFTHTTAIWTITLDAQTFAAPAIDDDEAMGIAGTVYHEARHAEQFHKMARMRASKGDTAQTISDEMAIPPEVAADAAAKPLAPDTPEFIVAEGQYDDVYGSGKARHRQAEIDAAAKKQALNQAIAERDANPTPANQARVDRARKEFNAAYRRYHDLPIEADAIHVEGQVEDTWMGIP